MNAISSLAVFYFFFTLISSAILYASFSKKLDESAIYFFISEFCMAAVSATIALINLGLVKADPLTIGIPNFGALIAELAILFSILSIREKSFFNRFLILTLLILVLTIFFETSRTAETAKTIIFIHALALTTLFTVNFLVCKFKTLPRIKDNQFIEIFCWFEFGLIGYGLLRLLASILHNPLIPRDPPSPLTVLALIFFILMSSLRYMSYIGFRITWLDPENPIENTLNKSLAKSNDEKNQFLQRLLVSNRLISINALASSLAHQLSQPLTTIGIKTETALRNLTETGGNSDSVKLLNEINSESEKISSLVHNLRRLFGNSNEQFKAVNLKDAFDELIEVIQPALDSKNINLLQNIQDTPRVLGDPIQLQQALINIINNAIEAIAFSGMKDRTISFSIFPRDNSAVITISDNGPGIRPNLLPRIFEIYNTTKENSLGIGLWLCKVIIEKHHGNISAYNNTSGGAFFEIEIPISELDKK